MVVMVLVALLLLCVIGEGTDRTAGGKVTKPLVGDRRRRCRRCCTCTNNAAHLNMLLVVTMAAAGTVPYDHGGVRDGSRGSRVLMFSLVREVAPHIGVICDFEAALFRDPGICCRGHTHHHQHHPSCSYAHQR